jgi:flavin-dependent dehydrogenase
MNPVFDYCVIGAGIVGLSVAYKLPSPAATSALPIANMIIDECSH